jgi:hypothetical protein
MVPPDPIEHIRERLDSHIDTEDADRVEIRERLVRVEMAVDASKVEHAATRADMRTVRDDVTELKTLARANSNAVRVYLWPVLIVLLTAVGTYLSARLATPQQHYAPPAAHEVPR